MHEQSLGGHDHAGGAETALDGSFLNEDLLDLVQFPILLQTFDGQDALAFQLAGKYQAGVHGLAVDDDGAGAALTLAAAFLGTGEAQVLPQEIQQALVRAYFQLGGTAVGR